VTVTDRNASATTASRIGSSLQEKPFHVREMSDFGAFIRLIGRLIAELLVQLAIPPTPIEAWGITILLYSKNIEHAS
jgi:hypothetical protein